LRRSVAATFVVVATMLCSCSDEFSEENYSAGPYGEPPKALGMVYSKQFVAEEKNYIRALGEIHAFLIENSFYLVYRPCFGDVLNIKVTANPERHERAFPCIAVQAEKGAPTKVYLSVSIDDVKFNQLDHNNRLIYTVAMYGRTDLIGTFVSEVEPSLAKLYTAMANHAAVWPHNKSPHPTRVPPAAGLNR